MKKLFMLVYALAFVFWACSSDSDSTDLPDGKVPVEEENNFLSMGKEVVRKVLMEVYDSTGGKNWTNQPNWETEDDMWKWDFLDFDNGCLVLNLSENNLSGTLPKNLFNLRLEALILDGNQIGGEIPDNAGTNGLLEYLSLKDNNFTGNLPLSLTKSTFLEIRVAGNRLSGEVPVEFRKLKGFIDSKLLPQQKGYEFLVPATVEPQEIDKAVLMKIYDWIHAENPHEKPNWKEEKDPYEWDNVEWNADGRVSGLYLWRYELDTLSSEINNLEDLLELDLDDSGLTSIPSLAGLKNLTVLWLSNNYIGPNVPEWIYDMKNLEYLLIYDCNFQGPIPQRFNELTKLRNLDLSENAWTGKIPALDKLTRLLYLDISSCDKLDQQEIPEWIGNLSELQGIDLSSSHLTGEIPASWKDKNWIEIVLEDNSLSGNIQHFFEKCDLLHALILDDNNFSGPLPELTGSGMGYLHLSGNQFSGPIPENWSVMEGISSIHLSDNNITGNIPLFIKEFDDLSVFYVDGNKMSGAIPAELLAFFDDINVELMPQQNGYGFTNLTVTQKKEKRMPKHYKMTKRERFERIRMMAK